MSEDEELIFSEDNEAVLVDTASRAAQESVQEFLNLDDQQRLAIWASLSALPRSSLASSWMSAFQVSSCDAVLTALLEDGTVDSWVDGCSDIINRAIPFLALWFAGTETEQALKIHWRNLNAEQQQWASFLDEQMEGGGALSEWGRTVGSATDVRSFTQG